MMGVKIQLLSISSGTRDDISDGALEDIIKTLNLECPMRDEVSGCSRAATDSLSLVRLLAAS